jgi:hypothetical protein
MLLKDSLKILNSEESVPSLGMGKLRQDDPEFEAILHYIMSLK